MRVVVIGGTGFIGHHVVNQLLNNQHQVRLLSRSPERARQRFNDQVEAMPGNLDIYRDINFAELFADTDAVIYAAGVDERESPEGDTYHFFYKENVTTCVNVLEKAKQNGVKHAVVLGSIFTHINREKPELKLSHYHPYIRSREEQQKQSLKLADNSFQVNIVEIPYVFGASPGCESIWKSILNYVRLANPLMVSNGGANVISVQSLAQAICGVLAHIDESGPIPVGDENMNWKTMLERLSKCHKGKSKKVTIIQDSMFNELTRMGAFFHNLLNMKSGLDQQHIHEIITNESYLDTDAIKQQLGYEGGDVDQAFIDTLESCPPPSIINNLNRSIDWLSDGAINYLKKIDHRIKQKENS